MCRFYVIPLKMHKSGIGKNWFMLLSLLCSKEKCFVSKRGTLQNILFNIICIIFKSAETKISLKFAISISFSLAKTKMMITFASSQNHPVGMVFESLNFES